MVIGLSHAIPIRKSNSFLNLCHNQDLILQSGETDALKLPYREIFVVFEYITTKRIASKKYNVEPQGGFEPPTSSKKCDIKASKQY
jgi:hypothetical protein